MSDVLAAYAPWAAAGVALTGALLVVLSNHRLMSVALGLQYVLSGWVSSGSLGISVSAAQVVGGLLATAIVWLTWENLDRTRPTPGAATDLLSLRSFRWVTVLLVLFAAWGLGRRAWLGLPGLDSTSTLAATFMMLLGLLQASLYRAPMRVVAGLLTVLCGFGIAYGAVESSLAVIALLIVVHLGLALAGSYLSILQSAEPEKGLDA